MSERAEIEKAWEQFRRDNLVEYAKSRLAGVAGPDFSGMGSGPPLSADDFKDPFDSLPAPSADYDEAPELIFADAFLEGRRAGLDDLAAARRAYEISARFWETNAYSLASRLLLLALQMMTRSRWWGLARAAETVILALAEKLSDEESQAALGRKYGISRAAVNKDVSLIRKDRSFGHLTAFFYKAAGRSASRSESATAAHKKDKSLRANPPENSLMASLLKKLAA